MKSKRIGKMALSLLCCIALLGQAAGAAVVGNVEETADTLIISGVVEGGAGRPVAVNILKPGADLSQALAEEGSLAQYSIYIKTVVADEQGRYQFTVKKPDYGEYRIVVSAGEGLREERPLYLLSDSQMQARLTVFNQTPADQMAGQIEADRGLFGLQFEPYETLVSAGKDLKALYQTLADTEFKSAAQLRRTFRQETLAASVRYAEDAKTLEQSLQTYEEDWFYGLKTEFLSYWNSAGFTARGGKPKTTQCWLAGKAQAVNYQAAQLEMVRAMAVSAMMTNQGFSQADEALLLFAPVYEIDTSVYQGLQEKKELVYKEMMKKEVSSAGKIKSAFESAIQTVTNPSPGGNGTGGGGSGGGGGSRPGGAASGTTNIDIYETPNQKEGPSDTLAFRDLDGVPWAAVEITALAQRGILQGRADGQFEPGAPVAREEFVKMLVAAFGLSEAGASAPFEDVPEDRWSYPYVASAVKAGIVQGLSDSRFGAEENITRQDMAVMAARALNAAGADLPGGTVSFADAADIAPYAAEPVGMLVAAGVIHGTDGNQFQPQGMATRAEAAKIIYGLLAAAGK